eukprot:5341748-Prymnesium_polylepis.2
MTVALATAVGGQTPFGFPLAARRSSAAASAATDSESSGVFSCPWRHRAKAWPIRHGVDCHAIDHRDRLKAHFAMQPGARRVVIVDVAPNLSRHAAVVCLAGCRRACAQQPLPNIVLEGTIQCLGHPSLACRRVSVDRMHPRVGVVAEAVDFCITIQCRKSEGAKLERESSYELARIRLQVPQVPDEIALRNTQQHAVSAIISEFMAPAVARMVR